MRFIPYDYFTLETGLSPQEVHTRLAAQVRPEAWLNSRRAGAPYEGWVRADDFQINRVIGYHNSFLPIIHGQIRPAAKGTSVEVVMQMQWWVIAFESVWAGLLLLSSLAALCSGLSGQRSPALCMPGVMLLVGYAMCTIGFQVEAQQTQQFLYDLLARGGAGVAPATVPPTNPTQATSPPIVPVWSNPQSIQRLPRRWVGGTPETQRYGRGVEATPLRTPARDEGIEQATQRLPWEGPG